MVSVSLLSLLFASVAQAASTQCFWKGGSKPPSGTNFQPCSPTDTNSHCCDTDQTCLSNGLCLVKWDSSINTGACTDQTWGASQCFQGCDVFSTLYRCTGNKWCCSAGGNTTNCCNDPDLSTISINGQALIQNGSAFVANYTIAAVSSLASSTSGSGAASAAPTQSSSSDDSGTLAAGLGAGLGVGIPFLAIIGALSFLLVREKRKSRGLSERLNGPLVPPESAYSTNGIGKKSYYDPDTNAAAPVGVHHVNQRSELPEMGEMRPSELQS